MALRLSPAVIKKLGSVGDTLQKKDRRDTVQACIDHIRKHPEEAEILHLVLSAGVLPQLAKASVRELIPSCSTHICVLSLKLQKCILTHLRNDWKAHTVSQKQITYAVFFALGVDTETSIEHDYVDELIEWAEQRSSNLGHRIRKVTTDAATHFKFEKFGEYALVRDESCADPNLTKATHVEHAHTKRRVQLDGNMCITTAEWSIGDNWSRDRAALRHQANDMRLPLFSLFSKAYPDDVRPPERKTPQQKAAETQAAKKRRAQKEEAFLKESDDEDGEQQIVAPPISRRRILATPTPKRRKTVT